MRIFEFDNYKVFFRNFIARLPKRGHGEIARMAAFLGVNASLVSQILSGPRDFTLEQSYELCQYLGLSEAESEYFLLLIEVERAGTKKLKDHFKSKARAQKLEASKMASRIVQDHRMDDKTRAVFYSSWMYSALRLLTSVPGLQTPETLAQRLGITRAKATQMLRFLVDCNLCVEENGSFAMGPQRTHLETGSPFIGRHHLNWRLRSMQKIESLSEQEMMFTSPMVISHKDFAEIRKEMASMIQKALERVKDSENESLFCLNVDFFEVI